MRAAFITLVISSLWGFASFTPLVTAHNVHLLWVFTSVLMGGIFWSLITVHMADAITLWRRGKLGYLRMVYSRFWADVATFIVALAAIFLIRRYNFTSPIATVQLTAWFSIALLICAVRLAFLLVYKTETRTKCGFALATFFSCGATLWYVFFTTMQIAIGGLNLAESIWFYITMVAAAISMYAGTRQLTYIFTIGNLHTSPSAAKIITDLHKGYAPLVANRKINLPYKPSPHSKNNSRKRHH
ncbi:hypothetical protein CPBF426_09560 [Xanthomonas arboricola pv. juglandis]|uniref:hypothetical protein n=1 Tax=Xanthomonas TaxID=338 RepID=UPI000E8DCEDE|nr:MULTISPECIES: hypothetical protein [Xanthomonas]CAD1796404.1 hypothetical protein XSP_003636 [Xanthomonas sp. CPBF 426]CAG2096100.1 hypothetical protein XCY_003595 [Xanthomonas euroxanthea]SYZ51342.1 hypothetical protein CPBF426_09560 [Xanthomonas arboricola pv. juglandis]